MRIGEKACINLAAMFAAMMAVTTPATAQKQRPNIIMVMGDDIGWNNIGVYNQGVMAGRTPNLDQLPAHLDAAQVSYPRVPVPRRRYRASGITSNAPFAAEVQSNFEQSCCSITPYVRSSNRPFGGQTLSDVHRSMSMSIACSCFTSESAPDEKITPMS